MSSVRFTRRCRGIEEDHPGKRDNKVSVRWRPNWCQAVMPGHWRCPRAVEEQRLMVSREDDQSWPKKNIVGRQELEVRVDKEHISFEVSPPLPLPSTGVVLRGTVTQFFPSVCSADMSADGENRFSGRCQRVAGRRGSESVLLSRSGSKGQLEWPVRSGSEADLRSASSSR